MRLYQLSAHPLVQSSRHINLTITVTAAPGEGHLLPQPRVPHLRNGLSLLPWDWWRGVTMKATKMGAWSWRRWGQLRGCWWFGQQATGLCATRSGPHSSCHICREPTTHFLPGFFGKRWKVLRHIPRPCPGGPYGLIWFRCWKHQPPVREQEWGNWAEAVLACRFPAREEIATGYSSQGSLPGGGADFILFLVFLLSKK